MLAMTFIDQPDPTAPPTYPEITPNSSPDESPQTSPVPQEDDTGRPHDSGVADRMIGDAATVQPRK